MVYVHQSRHSKDRKDSGYGRLARPEGAVSSARYAGPIPQDHEHRGARSASGAVLELYPVSAIVTVSTGSLVSGRGLLCRGHIRLEREKRRLC